MASKYTFIVLLSVAFLATTATAENNLKDKITDLMNCLTEESFNKLKETKDETVAACKAELGLDSTPTETPGASTTAKPDYEPNSCLVECYWRRTGMVKDRSFRTEEFIKAHIKPEHQEKLKSYINECFTKEGLSTTYTVNKDDQCKSLEKYRKCIQTSAQVCK